MTRLRLVQWREVDVEGDFEKRRMLSERWRGWKRSYFSFSIAVWCGVVVVGLSLIKEVVNPQTVALIWGDHQLYSSSNSRMILIDDTISSEDYFWGNAANVTFATRVTLSKKGLFCLKVTIHDQNISCPYPDMRARTSGVAIVNIPLEVETTTAQSVRNTSTVEMDGCAWLPVVGDYYLDMNLLHCTINSVTNGNVGPQDLKGRCPNEPVVRPVKNYSFRLDQFERTHEDMQLDLDDPHPYAGAWLFAPVCEGSLHRVGKHCTANSGRAPSMLRTMFQNDTFLQQGGYGAFDDESLGQRFRDYVFLPTHRITGEPDYTGGRHATQLYAPSPRPDLSGETLADKVCLLGDSHARYLYAQLVAILEGKTANTTACKGGQDLKQGILPRRYSTYTLLYEKMEFISALLNSRSSSQGRMLNCDVIFISSGHWDAGYPGGYPTPPLAYALGIVQLLQNLEQTTAASRIYVLSSNLVPLGQHILECWDWRVPSLLRLYNSYLIRQTRALADGRNQFVANGLERSYFLDNGDISEPLWDAAVDWSHPCHDVFRPIAQRMLSFLKVKNDQNSSIS